MVITRERLTQQPRRKQSPPTVISICLSCLLGGLLWGGDAAAQNRLAGEAIDGTLTVTVVREGGAGPVSGAFVMVGPEAGNPFDGNHGLTGTDGMITFNDPALNGPQMVTAGAEGYAFVTFVEANADSLTLELTPRPEFDLAALPATEEVAVSGKGKSFLVEDGLDNLGDGQLDAGIVNPLLGIEDLLSFDASSLLAEPVLFQIGGGAGVELPLPDNVVLPVQKEYGTTIEKLNYRLTVPVQPELRLGALALRVGTEDLLEWLDYGGTFAELLPLLKVTKAGVTQPFPLSGPTVKDVSVSKHVKQKVSVEYAGAPEAYPILFLAAGDLSGLSGSGPLLPFGFTLNEDGYGYGSLQLQSMNILQAFPGMSYLYGAVAANLDARGAPLLQSGLSAVVDRSGQPQPPETATLRLDSFFRIVSGSFSSAAGGHGTLSLTAVRRDGDSPSPEPSLSVSRVLLEASLPCGLDEPGCGEDGRRAYDLPQWVVVAPGAALEFPLPVLPAEAPPFLTLPEDDEETEVGYRMLWDLSVFGLTFGEPFDFNRYDASTLSNRVTHLSRRRADLDLGGVAPARPANLSPANGATESPTPVRLSASVFADPDEGDTHTASRWQVRPDGDAAGTVLDRLVTAGELAQLEVEAGLLEPGRTYVWRVRYRDDRGMWSPYSAETAFVFGCQGAAICDDGLWCNGAEQCAAGECQPGTAPECGDGIDCTEDTCNEETDSCDHLPQGSLCDDGLWCNGAESCDAALGCQPGTAPECGDGVGCTEDTCNEESDSCDHLPQEGLCDDGLWCNGAESCDAAADCQPGVPPICDDGVGCTVDGCDEEADACSSLPDSALCDDGLWCNGAESCDLSAGCLAGTAPNCADAFPCTEDTCNEETDACDHLAQNSLCDDGLWCNGAESCDAARGCRAGARPNCADTVSCTLDYCDEQADRCGHFAWNLLCTNGKYCDGAEVCNPNSGCQAGAAVQCDDGILCTADSCSDSKRACVYSPDNSVCDDGYGCNGAESCDAGLGCRAGTAMVCDDGSTDTVDVCNEETDVCENLPGAIQLPNPDRFGLIPGGDQSHPERVVYTFKGVAGEILVRAYFYDIDAEDEVQISLNGRRLGAAALTPDRKWSGAQDLIFADREVLDDSLNTLVFSNARNPLNQEPWGVRVALLSIHLPNRGEHGRVPDSGEGEAMSGLPADVPNPSEHEVLFSFDGVRGDVLIEFESFDVDTTSELQLLLNGKEFAWVPMTANDKWGQRQLLLLPDDRTRDVAKNVLTFRHQNPPPRAAGKPAPESWWGVREVSVGIPLPAAGEYGKIPGGDQQHAAQAMFSFGGMPGDIVVEYQDYGVGKQEVMVLLNGRSVGYLTRSPATGWSGTEFLVLRDVGVNDSSLNVLCFRNLSAQADDPAWGVRGVRVDSLEGGDLANERPFSDVDSPFGLDYIFPMDALYRDPEIARQFGQDVGVRWVNFVEVMWDTIETLAPESGVHRYDWSSLDEAVRQWQQYGVNIMMSLRFNCYWATRERPVGDFVYLRGLFSWIPALLADYLPKDEHWQNLRDWVANLVERYDGDGFKDMPGLRLPILHFQMGNEYYNEFYWAGSAEEYGTLLKEVAQSARQSSRDVKVILPGVVLEDVYPFYGDQMDPLSQAYVDANLPRVLPDMRKFQERADQFSRRTLEFADSYDIVDTRYPAYGAVSRNRQILNGLGHPEKEIWSAEICTWVPFLDPNVLQNMNLHALPSPSREMDYLLILKDPNHPEFPGVNAWYRGLQAAMLVKNAMVSLHAGAKKLMMGWAIDVQESWVIPPLSQTGIMSGTFRKLWPAGQTYKLLIEKLGNIRSVRRVGTSQDINIYKCLLADQRQVLVAFYDDHVGQNHDQPHGVVQASIPISAADTAVVTHIIKDIDATEPEVEMLPVQNDRITIELSEYPVFIEAYNP